VAHERRKAGGACPTKMAVDLNYVRAGEKFRPPASTWNKFVDTARLVLGGRTVVGRETGNWDVPPRYWAKLLTDLGPGALVCPPVALADVWIKDESSSFTPQPLMRSPNVNLQSLPIVNRAGWLSGKAGQVARIEWDDVNAEWIPIIIGDDRACNLSSSSSQGSSSSGPGSSGSSSSSSPCGCISVITSISCGPSGLTYTVGSAQGCCPGGSSGGGGLGSGA
jgi:hypothetical protein